MGLDPYNMLSNKDFTAKVNKFILDGQNKDKAGYLYQLRHRVNPDGTIEFDYPGYVQKLLNGTYKDGGKLKFKSNIILKNNGK